MAEQPNISSILAALEVPLTECTRTAAQRPGANQAQPTPSLVQSTPVSQQPGLPQGYPGAIPASVPPAGLGGYGLPQPSSSGSLDLSSIKPVNSGTVSITDAIAKARGIAAEKGVAYESRGGGSGRPYRRSRSRSRSPPPPRRENFRDNYNPYRDERREDRRGANGRDFQRDRSFSPNPRDRRAGGSAFSPPPSRDYGARGDRSPRRGGSGSETTVETIQIDSSLVGLIIGRQGENLRRVESDTGARVQFITGPDVSGPTRDCKITGSRGQITNAKAEIFKIITDNNKQQGFDRGGRGGPEPGQRGSHQPPLRDGEDTMQIMVPDRTVGLIIGRGGETIRDLQDRSGCHVNIVGEAKSVNGLRPVNLIGSMQAASMAKELIMEIVDSDTKSLTNGPPQRDAGRGGGFGNYGGGGTGGGGFGGGDRINDSIRVPAEAVGMIIGKVVFTGGETIKEMQNSTGCKINVSSQSNQNDQDREIGLVGTRDSIERAKRAIEDKVDASVGLTYHQLRSKLRALTPSKQQKRGSGGGGRHSDQYSDRYSQPQQQYGQGSDQNPTQPQAAGTTAANSDPYAMYGGYNNYIAMWYAAMATQPQAQGQGEQPRPPGTA
ncbi:hypothetical protein GP486_002141 [Trichoglossum hirsutum]|uniref:K Homology domain-containing protein n=1 Tax=Trichoglossum hirsutum TaxID=265104 RepID=A0A9P8RRZ4_9PEZI|nr:hypothetical protein GP486_002141 [Trichoglossum hirsutum]